VDPKLQEPDFDTTLTDATEIRRRYGDDDNDWPRYKISVINSLKAGVSLTARVAQCEGIIEHHLVRKTSVQDLKKEVDALTAAANTRKSFLTRWGGRVWTVFIIVLTALITHWLSR
jgi:hypothetical protein